MKTARMLAAVILFAACGGGTTLPLASGTLNPTQSASGYAATFEIGVA